MAADDTSGSGRRRGGLPPVVGRKYVRAVTHYLADLRRLYPHPNRKLFYDDVVVAYLLAFFNPAVRSLRCLEDVTRTPAVNRFLSVKAVCRSTLSDANALFDPAHLTGLIAHVRARLPGLARADADLGRLLTHLVGVDGSYFRTAADVQWAMWHRKGAAKEPTRRHLRLNCAFCQATGVPVGVSVDGDDGRGEGASAAALIAAPAGGVGEADADRIYVFDSGVVSFGLPATILGRGEHVLCNLKAQVGFAAAGPDRPLTDRDRAAGVASDRVGRLTGSNKHAPPDAVLREVVVVPYVDRAGKARRVRILTDLLDLPAYLVAELYRHRWQVELFFRWLKVHANYRHLISSSRRNGVTTGFYVAVLAAMLLQVQTGRPLDKYALNLFGLVAGGLADPADVLPILARRDREKRLERERLARQRAEKAKA